MIGGPPRSTLSSSSAASDVYKRQPPCRMQGPIIEQLDKEIGDKVKITKMDVDANQETPMEFGIMSIPTLIIKKDGQVVDKLVGLQSKDQLKTVLAQYTN